jgi:hypothetical protein
MEKKMMNKKYSIFILFAFVFVSLIAHVTRAQELTPRAYWPSPKGTKVLVSGYSYTSGNELFDPSIPLYGVESKINTGILAYMQTFGLWGKTTNVIVELPYSWGTTEGLIGDIPAEGDFSGIGDLKVTMSINLFGAPSMTLSDFQRLRANPRPILGASLKVVVPTGYYKKDRLINVGANRWAVKPELGFMVPITPTWLMELAAGAWFFGDDEDFLPGKREQDPVFSGKFNLIKRIRPGFWASLDFTYFTGGRQTIGGNQLNDVQQNAKIGGTLVIPFRGRHAIKLGYANGILTEFGSDFNQFLVSYQFIFR